MCFLSLFPCLCGQDHFGLYQVMSLAPVFWPPSLFILDISIFDLMYLLIVSFVVGLPATVLPAQDLPDLSLTIGLLDLSAVDLLNVLNMLSMSFNWLCYCEFYHYRYHCFRSCYESSRIEFHI